MKITHEDYDQLSVLTIQGDLTADQIDLFRKTVDDRMNANTRDFVLDVQAMEFIDSRGLEAILWLQEQTGEKLGQVRLAGLTDNVSTILELTRLTPMLDCHASVELAVKSLR
jgi:anti-anti-sigma factor